MGEPGLQYSCVLIHVKKPVENWVHVKRPAEKWKLAFKKLLQLSLEEFAARSPLPQISALHASDSFWEPGQG